jgi:hypothetical protein
MPEGASARSPEKDFRRVYLSHDLPAPPSCRDVWCAVAAHGQVRLTADLLPAARQKPGPLPGPPLPASFLKQSDEQTVVGLLAVYRALHDFQLDAAALADWGVLAAPQLLGRRAIISALKCYANEGAWGISPHLIPHRSLHAVSGTISQALGWHGPNLGVGGGPGAEAEALLLAASLLAGGRPPGLWVVLTCGVQVSSSVGLVWEGLALALTAALPGCEGPCLEVGLRSEPAAWPALSAGMLGAALAGGAAAADTGWRLGCGGWARLCRAGLPAEDCP